MRLEELNSVDGERLALAMQEAGIGMLQEGDEVLLRAGTPFHRAIGTLTEMMVHSERLDDRTFSEMMMLACGAFCIGATYALMPSGRKA